MHAVTLHPIADMRIHIPVGIGGAGSGPGGQANEPLAPPSFNADWKGPITVIDHGDRLVFANAEKPRSTTSPTSTAPGAIVKSIAIDNRFTAEAALAAIDKMVSTQ